MPVDRQNALPTGGQWAKQQKAGMKKQEEAQQSAESRHNLSDEEQRKLEEDVVRQTQDEGSGDERTPDEPIGQVAYADGQKRPDGGAGEPQTTPMEPEKH